MNGKDSTLEELEQKVIGETRMSIALLESMAVLEYKATLKERIEALIVEEWDFDELRADTVITHHGRKWSSRTLDVVLAEIEKEGK